MSTGLEQSVREQNRDFLIYKLRHSEIHAAVERTFLKTSPADLAHLLRYHDPEGVSNPEEIRFRSAMDQWLGQVGLLYLAWLCGYIPDPGKDEKLFFLRPYLSNEALRAYYERHYPIAMPWLFRLHLEGTLILPAADSSAAVGAYERFSILYERFRGDGDLGQFLDFLEDFDYGSPAAPVNIQTVLDSFGQPGRVAEALGRPAGQVTRLDRGIVGLVRFLTFSSDLDGLLRLCAELPLVQSAFWFFYAYWFNEYTVDVGAASVEAVDKILSASTRSADSGDQANRDDLVGVMQSLTDGRYARVLLEEVGKQGIEFESSIQLMKPITLKQGLFKMVDWTPPREGAKVLKTTRTVPVSLLKEIQKPAEDGGPVHWISRFDRYAQPRPPAAAPEKPAAPKRPAAKKKRRAPKVRE